MVAPKCNFVAAPMGKNLGWALRASIPRPSPCKGGALPTELSARADEPPARWFMLQRHQRPRSSATSGGGPCALVSGHVPVDEQLAAGTVPRSPRPPPSSEFAGWLT